MSTASILFSVHAEKYLSNPVRQKENETAPNAKGTLVAPKDVTHKRQGVQFYRKYTESMLRRYMRLSMRKGRMPSLLGQDIFRGKTSTYRISSFEDAVIFVHDMDKCIEKMDAFSKQLITRIALQEYTQGEAALLLGVSLRTVVRRYGNALDDLTEILLDRKLMKIESLYK